MTHITPTQTAPIFTHQVPGGVLLEVYLKEGSNGFVGYCDGEPSVSGAKADIVLRGLERKHLSSQPHEWEGTNVVDFFAAKARLRPEA